MIKRTLTLLLFLSLFFIQCKKQDNTFLITNTSIGKLKKITAVTEIEKTFIQDSVIRDTNTIKLISSTKKIEVYEKGGKHLLSLTPNLDSIPKIRNIRVHDPRYKTTKGIGINSTFKDIRDNYTIKKISTSLNNIIVFLKEEDIYITIDKKELPESLRYATNTSIEEVQIPDTAKIKYFMIGWE